MFENSTQYSKKKIIQKLCPISRSFRNIQKLMHSSDSTQSLNGRIELKFLELVGIKVL